VYAVLGLAVHEDLFNELQTHCSNDISTAINELVLSVLALLQTARNRYELDALSDVSALSAVLTSHTIMDILRASSRNLGKTAVVLENKTFT
jgi:hypothetical protein